MFSLSKNEMSKNTELQIYKYNFEKMTLPQIPQQRFMTKQTQV